MTMRDIAEALTNVGPMTRLELQQHLELTLPTVSNQVTAMRRMPMGHHLRIAIKRYDQTGKGPMAPVYHLTPYELDVKKPAPLPRTENNRRYWARHRKVISAKRYGARSTLNQGGKLGIWAGLL